MSGVLSGHGQWPGEKVGGDADGENRKAQPHSSPEADQTRLYEAPCFRDADECNTVIAAARNNSGKTMGELLRELDAASRAFGQAALDQFGRKGEW